MNGILKKVISAAIAVSTLGSIALPVYAAETTITEDTVAAAENKERESFEHFYYECIEYAEKIAYAMQSSDLTSEWVYFPPEDSDCEDDIVFMDLVKFSEEVGDEFYCSLPNRDWYTAEIAPNGRLFVNMTKLSLDQTVNDYHHYADIQSAIEKGDSKVVDGRTFITLDGVDYEYYMSEPYIAESGHLKGHECVVLYYNWSDTRDITGTLYDYAHWKIDDIDSIFDTLQQAYDITMELIENNTIGHFSLREINRDIYDLSLHDNYDDDDILGVLAEQIRSGIVWNSEQFHDMDEFREEHSNCSKEVEAIIESIYAGEYDKLGKEALVDAYIGDINGDRKIDINDVTLLKKQIIHDVELPAVQQKMTSVTGNDKLDVRDLTKLTQYLVKATDSLR